LSRSTRIDDYAAKASGKLLPFTLAILFSGAGFYIFGFGLAFFGQRFLGLSAASSDTLFFIGLLVGNVGGGISGFNVGIHRNRSIKC
jgi:hypothetical protein